MGRLAGAQGRLPKGHGRSLIDYLVASPTGFQRRGGRLRPEFQGLYLSAYQSYLWNRMLAAWLLTTWASTWRRGGPETGSRARPGAGECQRRNIRNGRRYRAATQARVKPDPNAPWAGTVAEKYLLVRVDSPNYRSRGWTSRSSRRAIGRGACGPQPFSNDARRRDEPATGPEQTGAEVDCRGGATRPCSSSG